MDPVAPETGESQTTTVEIADPPREMTVLARRRAWTEPRVRTWWVLAIGVGLVTLYVVATQFASWWSERRLILQGTAVEATIDRAYNTLNDMRVPGKSMSPDSYVDLSFDWNGRRETVGGRQLPENIEQGKFIVTGSKITLRIDPADPSNWTARTVPPPLIKRQLIPVGVGVPVVAILCLLAFVKRNAVARVWRDGEGGVAMVVGTGQSAFAPRSRVLRCTAADSSDSRVFTVYLPAGMGHVGQGDVVSVVRPADKPEPAYAVAWFAGEK